MNKAVLINSNNKHSTKKELAKKLYLTHHTLPRKPLIDKFVEELHITENSARTHISWCAKELNSQLNKPFTTRNINSSKLKKEKAYTIFKNNPGLTRKEIIKLYETNLNMSDNSAATHCSLSVKRYINEMGSNINHAAITG